LRKAPPTLKVKTSFSIVASGATELSECDSSAEVAMRRTEGEGQMSERHMLDPTPELPDDTPIDRVRFPARIQNVLVAAGLKTVGEVRETSDEALLSFQDFGKGSVAHLRETLGLPSTDGVRPVGIGLKAKAPK
jgi:DNA-directed RNA polymerase alpha subunit